MNIASLLLDLVNLLTILVGFGAVITIHEFGHFIAARWAGVRVLVFSVGFGKPIVSYTPGEGWRAGSRVRPRLLDTNATEYRLSVIPLGGYVKMLGQDDADPTHTSSAKGSYNVAPVWKRMVIISAGVVFNVVSAAVLFIAAFSAGLTVSPPEIGVVERGSPASLADRLDDSSLPDGLRSGDRIVSIAGRSTRSFNDVFVATAMSDASRDVTITVVRPEEGQIRFRAKPIVDPATTLLQLGVSPALSPTLREPDEPNRAWFELSLAAMGIPNVPMGSTLETVDGNPVRSAHELSHALTRTRGEPVAAAFRTPDGTLVSGEVAGEPIFEITRVPRGDALVEIDHLAGFRPVIAVGPLAEDAEGYKKGLRAGDVFLRLGDLEFPTTSDGIREIQNFRGRDIAATVERLIDGAPTRVDLTLAVGNDGRIGFAPDSTGSSHVVLAVALAETPEDGPTLASTAGLLPGTRIVSVNGTATPDTPAFARALSNVTGEIEMTVLPPFAGASEETVTLTPDKATAERLAAIRWTPAGARLSLFEPATTVLRGSGPLDAAALGFGETRRVMETTYLTFLRLFQGSIKVEKLSGPVGIVHIGTLFAGRGVPWILFFFGMVSINLAVINFLPVPITDGGHMVFLLWEQFTGKPVSPIVQNLSAFIGLAALGVVFVIVTYNDILRLLGLG